MSLQFPQTPTFGFGVAGPLATPLVTQGQVTGLVRHALELGVNIFDSAPLYGDGLGETRLGRALTGVPRNEFFLTTKAGVTGGKKRDFSPQAIESSLHQSLPRLGVDHVDVLFLHGPDPSELTDDLLTRLQGLQEQGLTRFLGVAGRGKELAAALQTGAFDAFMLPMGPGTPDINREYARQAKGQDAAVFGIEMLGRARSGGLSLWPADWWHWLRQIRHGRPGARSPMEPRAILQEALNMPDLDVVLSTTSKKKHLHDWRQCLDERDGNP